MKQMSLPALRALAKQFGVPVQVKANKAGVIAALRKSKVPLLLERQVRDNLRPHPVLIFDPAAGQEKFANRHDRRHRTFTKRQLDGTVAQVTRAVPKAFRQRGTMLTVTRMDLVKARASL